MNIIKKMLAVGGLGILFAIFIGGVMPNNQVYAIDADEAEDIVYSLYSGAIVYDVEYDGYEYEVFFESDEFEYGSSVIIDDYGDVIEENLYYYEDEEDEDEEWY